MDKEIQQFESFVQYEEIRCVEEMIASKYDLYFQALPLEHIYMYKRLRKGLSIAKKEVINDAYRFCRTIYADYGFILPPKYSIQASERFWVMVYCMNSKFGLELKKRYLLELRKRLKETPKMKPLYAILYDKIMIKEGKKQRYATNHEHFLQYGVENFTDLKSIRNAMNLM